jgi:hypothetical protein
MNIAGTANLFPFLHYGDLWTQTFYHSSVRAKGLGNLSPGSDPNMSASNEAENVSEIPMEDGIDMAKFPLFAKAKAKAIRFVLEQR